MNDLSDEQLRTELERLSGKPCGPIMPTTRPLLEKRLQKLRKENVGKAVSYGFSSEEDEPPTDHTTAPSINSQASSQKIHTKVKRKSVTTTAVNGDKRKSITNKKVTSSGDGSTSAGSPALFDTLTNEELAQKLYELSGVKYPASGTTRTTLLRKLQRISTSESSSAKLDSIDFQMDHAASQEEPMETQFSDMDDELMDFESDPELSAINTVTPLMVNQSMNTSSFLDVTVDQTNADIIEVAEPRRLSALTGPCPDRMEKPPKRSTPYSARLISQDVGPSSKISFQPHRPSPPPSAKRHSPSRQSLPSSRPPPPVYSSSRVPTPPRSEYARRPLTTNFRSISPESTPKPTSMFHRYSTGGQSFTTTTRTQDYQTRYSSGKPLDEPDPRVQKNKKDKMMKSSEALRSCAQRLPTLLMWLFVIVFLALGAVYFYLWLNTQPPIESLVKPDDKVLEFLCEHESNNTSTCIKEQEMRMAMKFIKSVKSYLAEHAGLVECNREGYTDKKVLKSLVKKFVAEKHGTDVQVVWKTMINLILNNPHWNIKLFDVDQNEFTQGAHNLVAYLESTVSTRPMFCVIHQAMSKAVITSLAAALVVLLGYSAYKYGGYRKRKSEERKVLVYDMVDNITDLLESQFRQSREDVNYKPFLAISHIRDTLISPAERNSMLSIWNEACKFIKDNETRVRQEEQMVEGEEFQVWRWLGTESQSNTVSMSKTPTWQGSVFGDHPDPRKNKLRFRPTPCLKIRNMFDLYEQSGSNWPTLIEHALQDKLGADHGIIHCYVDRESEENRCYIKFRTEKQAGKAFTNLNGWFYGNKCIQAKFLLPDKYHKRFPEAEYAR